LSDVTAEEEQLVEEHCNGAAVIIEEFNSELFVLKDWTTPTLP
jgi:hypothetical protein